MKLLTIAVLAFYCCSVIASSEEDAIRQIESRGAVFTDLKRVKLDNKQTEFYQVFSYVKFMVANTSGGNEINVQHFQVHYPSLTYREIVALVQAIVVFNREELDPGMLRKQMFKGLCQQGINVEGAYTVWAAVESRYHKEVVIRFRKLVKEQVNKDGYEAVLAHAASVAQETQVFGGIQEGDGEAALSEINRLCAE